MAATELVRLLLIGAGRMGQTHVRALLPSKTVRISAVADPAPEALAKAAAIDPGLSTHSDIAEALADQDIDAVLIAAPSTLHHRLVSQCAEHGLPILCEKPCGTTLDDVQQAATIAQQRGVLLQVGYWRRYVPELVALRTALQEGRFGDVLAVSCWQWDAQPPDESFRRSSGGIIVDMAVHELDQIRWLTGQELTPASTIAAAPQGADPDCAASLLHLSKGGVAMISLGRHFPHGDCVWVELMGTRDFTRVDVLWGRTGDQAFLAALRAQAEDFAHSVVTGAQSRGASAVDARVALELAERLTNES